MLRRDTLTEGSGQVRARRRKVRGLVLPVAAALFALPAAGGQKAGQDANALVRKMIATYQAANTISGSSEAKMLISGAQYIQRTTWKYRKPNKLYMSSVDPVAGTFTLWLNDSIIVIYSGRQNIYTKRTTQPTLAARLSVAQRATRDAFSISTNNIINPISFLIARGMPVEAKSFRYGGVKTIEGKQTHLVTSSVDPAWVRSLSGETALTPQKGSVAFWIDTRTNLLVKGFIGVSWLATQPGQSRSAKPTVRGGFAFEEVYKNTVMNGTIPDSDFEFVKPKGAVEKFQER